MVDGNDDNPDRPLVPRHTGRGIVIRNGNILLMERWRLGKHYFSIPGGGIEADETPEQAAIREIYEETTIVAKPTRLVLVMQDGDIKHSIFLCEFLSGVPELTVDSPEAIGMSEDNRFKPGWIKIDDLDELSFIYWEPLKKPLIEGIKTNFAGGPVTVTIIS